MTDTRALRSVAFGEWFVVNDDVMGGVSRSEVGTRAGVLRFAGQLSLDNNGGFVSTRAPIHPLPRATVGFRFEARGDGRSYQLRLRPGRSFDGVAWRATFATTPGTWATIEIPLDDFEPVFRGRQVRGVPPLGVRQIGQLGFLLADRKAGDFELEIRSLEAVVATPGPS